MYPGLFLDRDGVIIENRKNYVRCWKDVMFYPQALSALASLRDSPFKIAIVTNQSVVGRDLISIQAAKEINRKIYLVIEKAGGHIDEIYMCPHIPADECDCRKPKPGLILRAVYELSIDLNRSVLVGDALSDVQAGKAAGVPENILVRTGRGESQLTLPNAHHLQPFFLFDDLKSVVDNLLTRLL